VPHDERNELGHAEAHRLVLGLGALEKVGQEELDKAELFVVLLLLLLLFRLRLFLQELCARNDEGDHALHRWLAFLDGQDLDNACVWGDKRVLVCCDKKVFGYLVDKDKELVAKDVVRQ